MTGITHKQAKRFLRAATDGLIRDDQRTLLNAHLRECDSCRAEADELNALEARLKKNFQAKWDVSDGPSTNVIATIQSRSRRIIMSNRINIGFKALASIAALVVLGFAINYVISHLWNTSIAANESQATNVSAPVSAQFPSIATDKSNGEWIAFIGGITVPWSDSTALDIAQDIYMVHPDGTGLINLTNNEDHSGYLFSNLQWSYDGKHLAVLENVDGKKLIIRVTQYGSSETMKPFTDPDNYGYSWSPTSYKIAFADASSGNYDIYTVYQDGRNDPELRQLTNDPAQDVGFVWSPDGTQIAFERRDGKKLSVYIMNEDGSNQHEIARGSSKVNLRWSLDGQTIYASTRTESDWLDCETCIHKAGIYRIDINGSVQVHQIYAEQDTSKVQAWYLYDTPQNSLYFARIDQSAFLNFQGNWSYADGSSIREIGTMDPHQTCMTTTGNILGEHISPNERFSVITDACAGGFDLYLADREATTPEKQITHLLRLPLSTRFSGEGGDGAYLPIFWSPDGRAIIYKGDSGYGAVIYLLDIERMMQDPTTKLIPLTELPTELSDAPNIQWFGEIQWQPQLKEESIIIKATEEKPTPEPLTFTLTVKEAETQAGFDVLEPSHLPEGYMFNGASYDSGPQWVILEFIFHREESDYSKIINIIQKYGTFDLGPALHPYETPVPIGDVEGVFIRGAYVSVSPDTTAYKWDTSADSYALNWKIDDMAFSINFLGGETIPPIPLADLVAIAESMK